MISREKCLEMVQSVGLTLFGEETVGTSAYEALINRAYQEGARDMRERAAKVYSPDDTAQDFIDKINNLEIK